MRSLRFRLPALFLAGIVLAGIVAAFTAARLFQELTRADSVSELRRQAAGLADLYAEQALQSAGEGRQAPRFAAARLERATGTQLYYAGLDLFPGADSGLQRLDPDVLPDQEAFRDGREQTFEFEPPGQDRMYIAVAEPLTIGGQTFGALVAAKPRAELRERWQPLVERLALAFLARPRGRGRSRLVPVAPPDGAGRRAHPRHRRGRAGQLRGRSCRPRARGTRSGG